MGGCKRSGISRTALSTESARSLVGRRSAAPRTSKEADTGRDWTSSYRERSCRPAESPFHRSSALKHSRGVPSAEGRDNKSDETGDHFADWSKSAGKAGDADNCNEKLDFIQFTVTRQSMGRFPSMAKKLIQTKRSLSVWPMANCNHSDAFVRARPVCGVP